MLWSNRERPGSSLLKPRPGPLGLLEQNTIEEVLINDRHSHSSRGREPKIKAPADSVSSEDAPPRSKTRTSYCILTWQKGTGSHLGLFYKGTNPHDPIASQRPTPNTITLGARIEHINFEGDINIQTTAPCDSSRGEAKDSQAWAKARAPLQVPPAKAGSTSFYSPGDTGEALGHWNPYPTARMVAGQSDLARASRRPARQLGGTSLGPDTLRPCSVTRTSLFPSGPGPGPLGGEGVRPDSVPPSTKNPGPHSPALGQGHH